jgi:hypothetical protein
LLLTYSNILRRHAPERFPQRVKKIKDGVIYNIVNVSGAEIKLSKEDQRSAINLIHKTKEQLSREYPGALLELKNEIEQVTLARLIEKFEDMLTHDLSEAHWQKFLKENSFILSLAFSYPMMIIQDQAHVGGMSIQGGGTKITDFLLANKFTGNVALFEIKRPQTELLRAGEYRGNLFPVSRDLSSSIAQVLDQKFNLQGNFTNLAYYSGWNDYHPFAIHCYVLIGRSIVGVGEKKSFEFHRNSLKDVNVITFDELLEKLRILLNLFKTDSSSDPEASSPF